MARPILQLYLIAQGLAILVLWAFSLFGGVLGRRRAAEPPLLPLIAAEVVTAVLLIASGVALRFGATWAPALAGVAAGALLFAALNGLGTYVADGRHAIRGLPFAVGLVGSLVVAVVVIVGS